ncbi:C-X-C chemokine receptor type 3-2-like [Trichomycterus rosablanca]|uniref:C-X-C chemokine receptor type 3-2-like n=1 Tax=Trichomycterus rosablanca TaxID=2290929 RepID=UPI002F35A187
MSSYTTADFTDTANYSYEDELDGSYASPCNLEDTLSFTHRFAPIAYIIVFILALVGNILVLCVVRRYRKSCHGPCSFSLTDTFLLHLAISDLLLALTLPLFAGQWINGWVYGVGLCKIAGALFSLNVYCGVLFLACISFDRYLAIVHAVHTSWRRNTCLAQLACSLIWISCLALASFDIYFRNVEQLEQDNNRLVCHLKFTGDGVEHWHLALQLLSMLLGFGLPLMMMLYCYLCIFRALCHTSTSRQKRRSLRLIISLVAAFVICWAPYNILKMIDSLVVLDVISSSCTLNHALDIGILVTESLGLAHCALNPLLYGFVGVRFRRELIRMFKAVLHPGGWRGATGWAQGQGSSRRQMGSLSSAESENTSYFSVVA